MKASATLSTSGPKKIRKSADLNFKRWDVLGRFIFSNPRAETSFNEAIGNLKTYLRDRFDFLDRPEYLNWDPEAASIEMPEADSNLDSGLDIVVSAGTISLSDSETTFTVTAADGRTCFHGTGTTAPLAPGIYIVSTGTQSAKVAL